LHSAFGYMHAQTIHVSARARTLLRAERGQGTVEYVALVLLVALVMFGVLGAMKTYKFSGGQELGDLIVKKIRDAVSKVRY
jgi:Flp pilus assembly pilin Flp